MKILVDKFQLSKAYGVQITAPQLRFRANIRNIELNSQLLGDILSFLVKNYQLLLKMFEMIVKILDVAHI